MSQLLEEGQTPVKKEDEEQNTTIYQLEALTDLLYKELVDEDEMLEWLNKWRKEEDIDFEAIFGSRTIITPFEYYQLQILRLTYFISTQNITGIECLHLIDKCEDENISDDRYNFYRAYLIASRISLLSIILQKETNQS